MNIVQPTAAGPFSKGSKPTLQFALALLQANLRNVKALAITLGMPLLFFLQFGCPHWLGMKKARN